MELGSAVNRPGRCAPVTMASELRIAVLVARNIAASSGWRQSIATMPACAVNEHISTVAQSREKKAASPAAAWNGRVSPRSGWRRWMGDSMRTHRDARTPAAWETKIRLTTKAAGEGMDSRMMAGANHIAGADERTEKRITAGISTNDTTIYTQNVIAPPQIQAIDT